MLEPHSRSVTPRQTQYLTTTHVRRYTLGAALEYESVVSRFWPLCAAGCVTHGTYLYWYVFMQPCTQLCEDQTDSPENSTDCPDDTPRNQRRHSG